jgi:hypothetical protein
MLMVTLFLLIAFNASLTPNSDACIFFGYFGYLVRLGNRVVT